MPFVGLEDPMRGFWMGGEKVDNRWQWTDGTNGTHFCLILKNPKMQEPAMCFI